MLHFINPNNGGPLKPPSSRWDGGSWGLATVGTILSALAETAETAGSSTIQIILLSGLILLAIWYRKQESEGLREMLRDTLSDLHTESTAERIQKYRLKYQSNRNSRKQRPGKKRI